MARYADACNLFGPPSIVEHKLEVLRQHCESEGRNYDDIEKSVLFPMSVGIDGSATDQLVQQLGTFAEAGVQTVIGPLAGAEAIRPLEAVGRDVIPRIASL